MRKRIMPIKYALGLTVFFLILFPILAFVIFYVLVDLLTVDKLSIYTILFFEFVGVCFEIVFMTRSDYGVIIIQNGMIHNCIFDGTKNEGWIESISDIKGVKLVKREEIQRYYKQFKGKRAILIDFGNHKIRYISAGAFSKKQLDRILSLLHEKNDVEYR